jgi:hypothetical protein
MGGVFNLVNLHVYHYAGNNPVKYTDPDGEWLALKERIDRIGEDIVTLAKNKGLYDPNTTVNPFTAKDEAWQAIKSEVNSNRFQRSAETFARRELSKTSEQIETWASNEQDRFRALLEIRDKSETKFNSIIADVDYEYKQAVKQTYFDENGRRIYDGRKIRDLADEAANKKLDELIKKEIPSYKIPED